MKKFEANHNGSFICDDDQIIGHFNDNLLCESIINFFEVNKIKSIYDFGCGNGFYLKNFLQKNYICEGYDGNPYTKELTDGYGNILDLSKKFDFNKKFDCVLSLEVGEHIPKDFETTFLENLINHTSNLLILSWGVPNQGGDFHVNERTNEYIIDKLKEMSFNYLDDETQKLRDNSSARWFKKSLMVFKKS